MSLLDKLRELGISENLIKEIEKFRSQYPVDKEYESRIPVPTQFYYGSDVWEQAITAVLCGENLLLVGEKATGKNLFAENLAGVFNRPRWNVSFHVNMDAASLIGTDTFSAGEVTFRPGPVYTAAKTGGSTVSGSAPDASAYHCTAAENAAGCAGDQRDRSAEADGGEKRRTSLDGTVRFV